MWLRACAFCATESHRMTDDPISSDLRPPQMGDWPTEAVRAAAVAYRRAKGFHGIEHVAVDDAAQAWLAAGGDEATAPFVPRVLRATQERHPDWFNAPGRRLFDLRERYYRRRGVPYPKAGPLPNLDVLLAEEEAIAARERGPASTERGGRPG
jgi:hypothetical protein